MRFVSRLPALAFAAAAAAAGVFAFGQPRAAAQPAGACQRVTHANAGYVVCEVDLRTDRLQLHWKAADGTPYGSLGALVRTLPRGHSPLLFAMNAGMYHEDRSPVGLYIENGQELKRANTASGPGNFHMKPNGVFYFTETEAGVLETGRYLKSRPKALFATQSGPMLVIDGKLHPRFSRNGPSLKVRNGVGVRDAHTVVFAISDAPVSFGDFARLFRDKLKAPNALFLDGSISSLHAASVDRADDFWPVGPILAATRR